MRNAKKYMALFLVMVMIGSGCANWQWGKRETGTLVGAATGAAIGAAGAKRKTRGALIGAAAGAVAGGLVGWYLDKQEKELARIAGLATQRKGDKLVVIMPGNILFDVDSTAIKPGAQHNLRKVGEVLQQYPLSDVEISGHTDSQGPAHYNQRLSERRAESVKTFMVAESIEASRITARGYGESQPIASDDTPEGRQHNRRVEINIKPRQQALEQQYG
jgi:outer membrane protein OmpA-like peptidoglycan-associated protein